MRVALAVAWPASALPEDVQADAVSVTATAAVSQREVRRADV